MNEINSSLAILLGYLNDNVDVRINTVLCKLYRDDYKAYKELYVEVTHRIFNFAKELGYLLGEFDNE